VYAIRPVHNVAKLFALALKQHQAGNLSQAERLYHEILEAQPGHADALHLLGLIAHQAGRHDEAIELIGRALTLEPEIAVYHANLGVAYEAAGELDLAAVSLNNALSIRPNDADTFYNLGNVLRHQQRMEEAVIHYQQAIGLKPDYAQAHCNLGVALAAQGKLDEAVTHYKNALRLNPNSAEYLNNLGVTLTAQDRLEEAVACIRRALQINPGFAPARHSLGCALQRLNQMDEALECYDRAIAINPQYAEAHWNRSLVWLLQGDFARGWPEYEWRWTQPGFARRHTSRPLWDGSELDGRTILLHAEQGLGDTLHLIRFARLVKQRGGRVIVECQPALARLLAGVEEIDHLVAQGTHVPGFDVQAPLGSLPGIFQISFDTIPDRVSYLKADSALVSHWRRRLGSSEVRSAMSDVEDCGDIGLRTSDFGQGFKIGIAWQGNPAFAGDRQRSIPLKCFAPLCKVPGARIISLQKGPGMQQLAELAENGVLTVSHLSDRNRSSAAEESCILELGSQLDKDGAFIDTAAVMKNLHLVITADSAIAHLAGALGVPVWVALPMSPDWRWLLERDESPWYPTMRLFRQRRAGDWVEVFERIVWELNRGHHRGSICFGLANPSGGPFATS
jgi:tetratricopeptide (TPR) repeat protein